MTKQFNLSEAIKGNRVVTKSGKEVKELYLFTSIKLEKPLYGLVNGQTHNWDDSGKNGNEDLDLFMK